MNLYKMFNEKKLPEELQELCAWIECLNCLKNGSRKNYDRIIAW